MAWRRLNIPQKKRFIPAEADSVIVGPASQLALKAIEIEWIWSSAELGRMSGIDGAGFKDYQNDFVISPASTNWKRFND